ncbi:hypothetical protein L873DRAFT_1664018 [Choiromyces venosus 120613-1]|uniref:Uncharacterized protein n=1 Tax=Choiromyces venosus 120613-1 TaxID=1336337 RepID=A0A3N4KHC6_9PEZI|nr:hypothetical protein L873DRAFT_1664018 [Choiromyces venosus 120613-1]
MGMSKTTVSFFLPIFFSTLVICAIVLCTCAYCYKPSYLLRLQGGGRDHDLEKAPRGRIIAIGREVAENHPSDRPEATFVEVVDHEVIDVLDAVPEGEEIDIIDAGRPPTSSSRVAHCFFRRPFWIAIFYFLFPSSNKYKMGLRQLRGFTIAITVLALISNGLSASLFQQFSNKLYRSSDGLVFYSYFATFVSALGVLGSIKQHAYAMSIFANFFIIDTIVSALSRSIILYVFSTFRGYICDDNSPTDGELLSMTLPHGTFHKTSSDQPNEVSPSLWNGNWGCIEIMRISVMVGWVSLVATTIIQVFFAILVRQYANSLFLKRRDDPERGTACFGESVREMDGLLVNQDDRPHCTRRASASSWTPSR